MNQHKTFRINLDLDPAKYLALSNEADYQHRSIRGQLGYVVDQFLERIARQKHQSTEQDGHYEGTD